MDQQNPEKTILNQPINSGFYVIWGILSLIFFGATFAFAKGSIDWPTQVFFWIATTIWAPISFFVFLIARKKIATWIFGIISLILILILIF